MFSDTDREMSERDYRDFAESMRSGSPFSDAAKGADTILDLRGLVKDYDGDPHIAKSLAGKDRRGQSGGIHNIGLKHRGTVQFAKKVAKGKAKSKAARKARRRGRK